MRGPCGALLSVARTTVPVNSFMVIMNQIPETGPSLWAQNMCLTVIRPCEIEFYDFGPLKSMSSSQPLAVSFSGRFCGGSSNERM